MGCGADYSLGLNNESGSKDVTWDFTANCHNMEIKYDHANTISKKINFNVKQVPGLAAEYNCSFNTASGLDFGAAVDTKILDHVAGVSGSFDVASGKLGDIALGIHRASGNTQCTWKADNIMNPCVGTGSVFVKLPNNKDFCCYGIQMSTGAESKLSLAAATSCCKNSYSYKLDHDGTFHIAKGSKLSKEMTLNLSSSLNLKNLSNGNHKFGAGLSWE